LETEWDGWAGKDLLGIAELLGEGLLEITESLGRKACWGLLDADGNQARWAKRIFSLSAALIALLFR